MPWIPGLLPSCHWMLAKDFEAWQYCLHACIRIRRRPSQTRHWRRFCMQRTSLHTKTWCTRQFVCPFSRPQESSCCQRRTSWPATLQYKEWNHLGGTWSWWHWSRWNSWKTLLLIVGTGVADCWYCLLQIYFQFLGCYVCVVKNILSWVDTSECEMPILRFFFYLVDMKHLGHQRRDFMLIK